METKTVKCFIPLLSLLIALVFNFVGCENSTKKNKEITKLKAELEQSKNRIQQLEETLKKLKSNPPLTVLLKKEERYKELSEINLIDEVEAISEDGTVHAVIEIPASSTEKWETQKDGKTMAVEFLEGKPRIINYIGYPGNYGLIPNTKGGDGDPLDIIILGNVIPRGKITKIKLIGVLKYKDRGEQDDKLIGLHHSSPFYEKIDDVDVLNKDFPGVIEILKIWFSNYKGPGKMVFEGLETREAAMSLLKEAILVPK